jgi:hypothetical protein
MAGKDKGLVTAGLSLLWRRQGILCWVFAVNFICGALGTAPAALTLNRALHHSLAGQPLTKGFDLGMLNELFRLPDVGLMRSSTASYIFACLFFLFMLFVSGGILETYRQDSSLTTGDFFAASGGFFWRFVRLMLFSLVPFTFLWSMYPVVNKLADYVGDRVVADQVGFFIDLTGTIILALLALLIRLWFDVAKIRAVAQNECGMWHNMWKSCDITWRNLGTLFWMYFRISLLTWIVLLLGFLIWTKLPPTATPITFVLLEFMILSQLTGRLWHLASATTWYQRHAEPVPAESVDYTTPNQEEVIEPATSPEPDPPPSRPVRTGEGAALINDL